MTRLLSVLAAAAAIALPAAGARAEPALWVAHGPNSTVYLFGTVHVLRKGTDWRSPKVAKAFAASQDLWLEITDDDPAKLQPVVLSLGVDKAHPLSSHVPPADLPRLDAAAKAMGAPGESALEPMRPWLAALTLSVAPLLQAGYDPNSGVEKLLKADAAAAGKPLNGFETAEGQMHLLADMPEKLQVEFLESALDDAADGPAKIDALVKSWEAGDVAAIDKLENDELIHREPAVYKALIADRNHAFADRIADRLQRPGVSFVAVGAAHLAGPDSVQRLLEQKGIKVERE